MEFPFPHLKEKSERWVMEGSIRELEFSGTTYQLLIKEPQTNQECWVFLQLTWEGEIKDCFCTCEEENDWDGTPPCIHIATAYTSLFDKQQKPLHQRYTHSLWNQLTRLYVDKIGDDVSHLKKLQKGYYVYQKEGNKIQFSIKGKTTQAKDKVEAILNKHFETEETSLKFSNLPSEELALWQEGRPSPQLKYELSFWSDLAKWLLFMQENRANYNIHFEYSEKQIPNWIQVEFEELDIGFFLSEEILLSMLPFLSNVHSPLKVYQPGAKGISHITYDKKKQILHVHAEKTKQEEKLKAIDKKNAIRLQDWLYIPNEGFYNEEYHILLKKPELKGEEISHALTEYGKLISNFLIDNALHFEPISLSYSFVFDSHWNLHISSYLFHPNDLSDEYSSLIGDWAYLDHDGFYPVSNKRFDQVETVIPIHQVSDFVTHNRSLLSMHEGFQVHVKSIEYQTQYSLTSQNRLVFARVLAKGKETTPIQDFGSWVYLEGYGFYPKSASAFGFLFKPGMSISQEQIPLFIKMNRDELSLIPTFFNPICPITKVGLRIELKDKDTIKVSPEYELLPKYKNRKILFFDEFVYIDQEGFCELPIDLRLPEEFLEAVELQGKEAELFLSVKLDEIRKFIGHLDPKLTKLKEYQLVTNLIQKVPEKGKGWHKIKLFYQTERGLIPVLKIWKGIKKKKIFGFFDEGLIDFTDQRFEWLSHIKKEQFQKDEAILLSALEWIKINAFNPIQLLFTDTPEYKISKELFDELTQMRTPDQPDISGLLSHLRPYQELGVKWLWFLYHQDLAGLLCDEMGLGKTHQAMGLLASIHNYFHQYAEGIQKHFLIVCPTSVIYHWQEKLAEFLPNLKVHTFYGTKRTLEDFEQQYDILLTSYGTLRNEIKVLSKINFEIAIFDEIQIAKNPSSRIHSTLSRMQAQMKIGLTGTPIENYLRELKSLFDIVLPSYMPGETKYREFFIRPIEREQDDQRRALLNRLIKPFILRRKKSDVLKDLPDKIEEIAHCDLSDYQRHLYNEVIEQRRKHILNELEDRSHPVPYLHVFALLSSLKQICDHPAVYLKKPSEYHHYSSGKWELFQELLTEARESQQKVVVFSQYLFMLDIIEHYLAEKAIGFSGIRGSTQNRKEQIKEFNQNPECEVFVGSLQAAGLGVDLTAGSVVIHYDRWWNAARENQATDRVHRIGQKRNVQVFKLVTKNTFEEKIDAMIQRKGKLMEDVIGADEQDVFKKFTREELMDLLSEIKP